MSADPERPLPPGKLPGPLLANLLERYIKPDPSVIVGPGIGRDAAALAIGDRIIVVKTDPITFVTTDAGRYLVNVNANDIVCMGAIPRWLLVTALLPEKTTTSQLVEEIFESLANAAHELGIALVGGHSEITLGLDRPILVGQMIGETDRTGLLNPERIRAGDAILLTGGIAIEGTAILAREAGSSLRGIPESMLERARGLLERPGISVIPAVRALQSAGVTCRYLHDPTEGGIATALMELAIATGSGIEVVAADIPVLEETTCICDALGLDVLGLIASGALLAVVDHSDVDLALFALHHADITVARIGTMLPRDEGTRLVRDGVREPIPSFAVDEIARYFAQSG